MIVRGLDEVLGTENDVSGPGWNSRRLLLAGDGMGFSLSDTLILPGAEMVLEYRHHFEACYCIEGRGEVMAHASGIWQAIEPFTVYALDLHDRHILRAFGEGMRLVCTFNPGLSGQEVHRADGSYAPVDDQG